MSILFARRAVALIIVLASALLVPAGAATAAAATPFGVNLLKNGSAEAGPARAGAHVKDIPHWTHGTAAAVVKYGSPGFPTKTESNRIGGGKQFFSCGPNSAETVISQKVKITGRNTAIDDEQVRVDVKARIATYGDQPDYGLVELDFGAGTHVFSSRDSDTVTGTNGTFRKVTLGTIVDTTARYFIVSLVGVRQAGDYCDAYFDKVTAVLSAE